MSKDFFATLSFGELKFVSLLESYYGLSGLKNFFCVENLHLTFLLLIFSANLFVFLELNISLNLLFVGEFYD